MKNMSLSVIQARKIMGKEGESYSDTQIEELVRVFAVLADMAIDSYIDKHKVKQAEYQDIDLNQHLKPNYETQQT